MPASLPYHEPTLVSLLVLGGFTLLLNIVNDMLDDLLYCGLIGQIFIGTLFGASGVRVLGDTLETVITEFGYLGLILSVYEGKYTYYMFGALFP